MAATAHVPEACRDTVPEATEERQCYALSFGSTVAHLWWDPHAPAVPPTAGFGRGFTEGDLVCGMLDTRAGLLARLWREGFVPMLVERGLLPALMPAAARQYPFALRLLRTPVISFGHEWCGEMWKAATLAVIDLMTMLAPQRLTLRLPNPWYVMFDGPKPVYINPGAIGPLDEQAFRIAVDRLVRGFLFPLHFCRKGQSRLARTLQRSLYGIRSEDFPELRETEQDHREASAGSRPEEFLERLRDEVAAMELPESAAAVHSGEPPLKACDRWSQQQWAVHRTLTELRPKTVLDVESSNGWSARLAAVEGAEVVAADLDEAGINRLYRQMRQENAHVLPLVLELIDPSPGLGMNNAWLPPASERLRADLVLALDTVHHLVLSGLRLSFDQVAVALAAFTKRWLLTEFVPLGIENGDPYEIGRRPDWAGTYDLDHWVRALRREFGRVTVLPAAPNSRRLVMCEK